MTDWRKNNQYTDGYYIKAEKIIIKNDIITMCELLNKEEYYNNICTFEPEPLTEGGIIFKFKNNKNDWYKTMRIYFTNYNGCEWYIVENNVMDEWKNNDDIIANKNNKKIRTFLKSFNNAPRFTQEELKIWEKCFNEIGFVREGKYPSKKNLK
jgi:ssDNA-specific exonuclease RecJ